jgi:hypothetical protein
VINDVDTHRTPALSNASSIRRLRGLGRIARGVLWKATIAAAPATSASRKTSRGSTTVLFNAGRHDCRLHDTMFGVEHDAELLDRS